MEMKLMFQIMIQKEVLNRLHPLNAMNTKTDRLQKNDPFAFTDVLHSIHVPRYVTLFANTHFESNVFYSFDIHPSHHNCVSVCRQKNLNWNEKRSKKSNVEHKTQLNAHHSLDYNFAMFQHTIPKLPSQITYNCRAIINEARHFAAIIAKQKLHYSFDFFYIFVV